MTTRLLTVPEVADHLRLSLTHTYRLIEAGDIAATRMGRAVRVSERSLEDYIASRTVPAKRSRHLRTVAATSP